MTCNCCRDEDRQTAQVRGVELCDECAAFLRDRTPPPSPETADLRGTILELTAEIDASLTNLAGSFPSSLILEIRRRGTSALFGLRDIALKPATPKPVGETADLSARIVTALTLHCDKEHMTIGERRCCREVVEQLLKPKPASETADLLTALKTYGQHLPSCEKGKGCKHCNDPVFWHTPPDGPVEKQRGQDGHPFEWKDACTCGFDAALLRGEATQEPDK